MPTFTNSTSSFLPIRPRRRRRHAWLRDMIAETTLLPQHLIQPIFINDGQEKTAIHSLPDVFRYPVCQLAEYVKGLSVPAIILFPATPNHLKNDMGDEALNPDNLICRAIQEIKQHCPDIGIITDVALDPYTNHGHDGLLEEEQIVNDATVRVLCQQALIQAQAGADIIAPSDMMDGRVAAIRMMLDQQGFEHVSIMSYTAKYASPLYGAFRDAVGSKGALQGDKRTYQMDYRNQREALIEAALDTAESADFLIIKPALPYLDIISTIRQQSHVPLIGYQVSGEYAMLKHAAAAGAFDFQEALLESLYAIRRAGASAVICYAAEATAKHLIS